MVFPTKGHIILQSFFDGQEWKQFSSYRVKPFLTVGAVKSALLSLFLSTIRYINDSRKQGATTTVPLNHIQHLIAMNPALDELSGWYSTKQKAEVKLLIKAMMDESLLRIVAI